MAPESDADAAAAAVRVVTNGGLAAGEALAAAIKASLEGNESLTEQPLEAFRTEWKPSSPPPRSKRGGAGPAPKKRPRKAQAAKPR